VARISADRDCVNLGGFIHFDGRASAHETGYHWDFGDGTTSDRPAPIHAYTLLKSSYTVRLTVTGPGGSDDATKKISIPCP
jgi:PKD repeat protein